MATLLSSLLKIRASGSSTLANAVRIFHINDSSVVRNVVDLYLAVLQGKNGKYYPAYHCSNHGHYFRVPKDELEATVAGFIGLIKPS